MKAVGESLKTYRDLNGLSTGEVALLLDIAEKVYTAMEEDETEISLKQLLRLCRYYGVKPDVFLEPDAVESESVGQVKEEPIPVAEIIEEEPEDDTGFDYLTHYGLQEGKRKMTALQAAEIYKKHGEEITEEQAEKVLKFMDTMIPITMTHVLREKRREERLVKNPKGFPVKSGRFSCRLCGHGGGEHPMWYDRFGLKCRACQNAVDDGLIPGEIAKDHELFYSEFDLGYYFNLKGKALREWIKKGLLKSRTILQANGRGKHYRVFLMSEHEGFLPPLKMFRIGGWVADEDKDGNQFYRTTAWYEYVDPFEYLKDYGIIGYMKYKEP